MSANEPRIRNLIRAIIIGVFLLVMPPAERIMPNAEANEAFTKELLIPDTPEKLPYLLHTIMASDRTWPASIAFVDIDNDSRWECFKIVNELKDSSFYDSRVVTSKNYIIGDTRENFQHNSAYNNHRILSYNFIDVVDDSIKDLILSRCIGDTLLLEIVGLNDSCIGTSVHYITAAVGKNKGNGRINWGATYTGPLLGIDLNGDGSKELLYSCLAQPDSAIERGIAAYDVEDHRQIWFYPLADMVHISNFYAVKGPQGAICFVFATKSSANAYASNGMTSDSAYCAAIDLKGNELWRKTLGGPFFISATCMLDVNNDGLEEFLVGNDNRESKNTLGLRIMGIEPFTGKEFLISDNLKGETVTNLITVTDSIAEDKFIFARVYDNPHYSIYKLDKNLNKLDRITGEFPDQMAAGYIIPQEGLQIITPISLKGESMMGVFNSNFDLLAYAPAVGNPSISYDKSGERFVIVQAANGYNVFTVEKQAITSLIYARYKWWLAVLTGLIGTTLLVGVIKKLPLYRKLVIAYHSTAGVSGLDKVTSMIIVLNRKGAISYANDNPLTKLLLGERVKVRQSYLSSQISHFPDILNFIKRSLSDPYALLEGQYEVLDGIRRNIYLIAYPRVDQNQIFQGKIIIGEDITGKADYERKAMLGDAVRFWIHQFKGKMATIEMMLENLQTAAACETVEPAESGQSMKIITEQVDMAKQMAEKILQFIRIGKPELIACDIDMVIKLAIERSGVCFIKTINVVRMLRDDLPKLELDVDQINEVLTNLITNAVDAMAMEGTLTVKARLARNLQGRDNKDKVEILIRDTGHGILPENIEKIFQIGFTSKKNSTGLGLAFVKEIMERHGGLVTVESEINKGTMFTLSFPLKG